MASPKTLQVPVTAGMRQDLSEHMAAPGTLTYAKNVRFLIDGEVQARSGSTALVSTSNAEIGYDTLCTAGPDYLARVPGGFVFGCKGFGFRYDFSQSQIQVAGSYGNAVPIKRLTSIAREELTITPDTPIPYPLSQAVSGGYICVVSSINEGGGLDAEDNGLFAQLFTEGGSLVWSADLVAVGNATAAYVVADASAAGSFIIVYRDGTTLNGRTLSTNASGVTGFSAATSVGTLSGAAAFWAACPWPGIGWALVYQSAAAVMTIAKMVDTVASATQTFAVTGTCPVSCFANATYLYIGYRDLTASSDSKARVYSTALVIQSGGSVSMMTDAAASVLTPPLFGPHVSGDAKAFAVVGYTGGAGTQGTKTRAFTLTATGTKTTGDTARDAFGVLPVSMPFNNGMVWCRREIGNGIPSQRMTLLDYQLTRIGGSSVTDALVDPKVALVTDEMVDGETGGSNWQSGWYKQHLGQPVQMSTGYWVAGLPRAVRQESIGGFSSGLALWEWYLFDTEAPRATCELGDDVIIAGDPVTTGHPWGTSYFNTVAPQIMGSDLGFYSAPTISSITTSNSTGDLRSTTLYQYRAVIERIDPSGNRFRSAPSAIYSVTTGAADDTASVTVLYPSNMLRFYSHGNVTASKNVVHLYRTASVGVGVTGQQFQRCTPPQGVPFPANGTVTYIDGLGDTTLAAREFIYTDGGVFDNNHPTSARFVRSTEDRAWLGGIWDSNQVQSSKVLVPGEPPEFSDSPAFRVPLPKACTGLAIQDGIVIAFSEMAIYAIQGAGPNDQGQGAWDSPRCITSSTGSTNPLSIVETSVGVFFESDRGIELLPRGCGEPQFIGEPVMDLMSQLGSTGVLSACVVSTVQSKTVRFCIGGPYVMVFDLDTRAWSFDQYPVNVAAICDTDQGAVLALEDASGGTGFYLENAASSLDNATEISSDLVWAAVRPFGIAGYGKFIDAIGMFDEALGYRTGNCALFMTVDRFTDSGSTFDMGTFNQPDYRKHEPQYNTGSAAKLRLTTTVGGWRFMGFTVELEEIPGGRRMTETEQS
jgi:hypothetical protein